MNGDSACANLRSCGPPLIEIEIARTETVRAAVLGNCLLVFAFSMLCFIPRLDDSPLARTEAHRVIAAHQMVQSGDYLVPHLFDHVYLRKPPLQYWVLAGAEHLLGPGELTGRLPSAVEASLLAAMICLMTARWIGPLAGLLAGLACTAIVPLWFAARSADLDALNTLASVAASLSLIEIVWRNRDGRSAPNWIVGMGIAGCGAALLTKGQAGLPIILGAVVGPAIAERNWRLMKCSQVQAVFLGGAAMLMAWIVAVLSTHGAAPFFEDYMGIREIGLRLVILSFRQLLDALTAPVLVLLSGLPVTLAIGVAFLHRRSELTRLIGQTILAAFAIQLLTGTDNPRYAYINLPLFCPLVGMMIPAAVCRHWPSKKFYIGMAASSLLVCIAAMGFGIYRNEDRRRVSGITVAPELRRIVGDKSHIAGCNVAWGQPELFTYAGVSPYVLPMDPADWKLEQDQWLVLDDEEWSALNQPGGHLSRPMLVQTLQTYRHPIYICWYSRR
jgi:4-amino-4-deoxy-L-arabinose transferase-like glycosyltransferase